MEVKCQIKDFQTVQMSITGSIKLLYRSKKSRDQPIKSRMGSIQSRIALTQGVGNQLKEGRCIDRLQTKCQQVSIK
jgi:hypothetical protein